MNETLPTDHLETELHAAPNLLTADLPDWRDDTLAPWPHPVPGDALLDDLAATLRRFVVLPKWADTTLALWIIHTYAFQYREVSTYVGVESPEKRCGKTTLLTVLSELVHRPIVASNISSPAFFRVIEETRPTLLIDEADTFLQGNDELRGILNSGYTRKTAFVVRVSNQPSALDPRSQTQDPAPPSSRLARFSCWCPKVMAAIGRLPETLADRCIVVRMQRKTAREECERLRHLPALELKQKCARFVQDHAAAIAQARPEIPPSLNDRAADIWEPLLALADLAGGPWPDLARTAAIGLTATAHEQNPIAALLLDIWVIYITAKADRLFSRDLVTALNRHAERPWNEINRGRPINELWLSTQLKPYGIRPRTLRIADTQAKGYPLEDLLEIFRRYIPKAEYEAWLAEAKAG